MSLSDYASEHGLKRMGARPPLFTYLREAMQRLDFAITLSRYSNEASNAKSRLGAWWNILLPIIQALTYGLIFGLILGKSRPENFLPFLFTGVFLYSFVNGSFTGGAGAMTNSLGLVRSLNFPRLLIPMSVVISQTLTLGPQLLVLSGVLLVTGQGISVGWLMLIPLLTLMFMFNLGLALIMARVAVHIQDLNKIIPFLSRIMFYVSGVFFSAERIFGSSNPLVQVITWNPIYQFLNLARGYLVKGYVVSADAWLSVSIWSVAILAVGVVFFWSAEERYGREF